MSSCIFDASSIVNLVKRGNLKTLEEGKTLDLAFYETLNAIWKELKLEKIDEETALEYAEILSTVFKVLKVNSIKGDEVEVLELAMKEGLTVYDSSYLYKAIKEKLILVTDDYKLRDKASKYVEVLNTEEFLNKMGFIAGKL